MQMSYASVVKPVAEWLDEQLWKILETATGLSCGATNATWNCVLPMPVDGRSDLSRTVGLDKFDKFQGFDTFYQIPQILGQQTNPGSKN